MRNRQGVTDDHWRARALAEAAIREAAQARNHPPYLINVALERIIEASQELPAYSTLDEMASMIRAEVNEAIFAAIVARMGPGGRQRAQGLLNTARSDGRSMFNRLKKRPSMRPGHGSSVAAQGSGGLSTLLAAWLLGIKDNGAHSSDSTVSAQSNIFTAADDNLKLLITGDTHFRAQARAIVNALSSRHGLYTDRQHRAASSHQSSPPP